MVGEIEERDLYISERHLCIEDLGSDKESDALSIGREKNRSRICQRAA